jgi:peptidyl-prolyl cis-trans isomerase D
MAIINKINEKSGLVVVVIVGALLLFLFTDFFFGKNSLFSGNDRVVGEIEGKNISDQELRNEVQKIESDYVARSQKNITENERPMIQEQAWNDLIFKIAYQKQFDKLGLKVSETELEDMIHGKHINSMVKQLFTNPQTQQFDAKFLNDFLKNLDKREYRDQALWLSVRNSLAPERLKAKYMNLFKKSEYVTKAEAEREYKAQNTKADIKYLFVNYYNVPDSTVKVTDDQIEDYISQNKDKYQVEEGRSLDYVIFPVAASHADSLGFKKELAEITQDFAKTKDDSSFIMLNSDNPSRPEYKYMDQIPEELKGNLSSLRKDSVYGPFNQYSKYVLYKVEEIKQDPKDSTYVARASHILFKPASESQADKDAAKKLAEKALADIKGGANFETMAKEKGQDGTAAKGGDLGWFNNKGSMVKPFEDAIFSQNKTGLIPKLVETQFGYHIIKITEPKTNKKYKIATVEKEISASEETKDEIYKKANAFAASSEDTALFNSNVKKDKSLMKYSAKNLKNTERYINNLSNIREIIRWAYEAKVGEVSGVFSLDNNQFVVAILTGKRDKGTARPDDVREEVVVKVRNDLKAEQILNKLKGLSGDIDKVASAYGPLATTGATQVTLGSNSIDGIGTEPEAIGKIFALKQAQKTVPFKGENGVIILQCLKTYPVPAEVADYNMFKTQLSQQRTNQTEYKVDEAIKKEASIKDERYKVY